ncbi:MAG: MerR family transcriptional regulator [Burkholderiaceae bacterium]
MANPPDDIGSLPPIPAKRYFTIGEVSELCGVKPHVLRYWEQEFTQLRPMKRRGNRRYYQHHEVLLVRRIRELLYEHGFTISGARNRLGDPGGGAPDSDSGSGPMAPAVSAEVIAAARADLMAALEALKIGPSVISDKSDKSDKSDDASN